MEYLVFIQSVIRSVDNLIMSRNDIETRKCNTPIDDNQYDDGIVTVSSIEKDNKRVYFPRYYQHKGLETSEGTDSSQQESPKIVKNKSRKTVLKSFTTGKHDGTRNVQAGKIQKLKKRIKGKKIQDKENAYQMTDNRRKKSNVKKKRMKNVIPLESSTTSPNISSLESPSSNCSYNWQVPEEIRDAPKINNFSEKLSPPFRQEIISDKEEFFENPQLLRLNNNLVVDPSEVSIIAEEEFTPFSIVRSSPNSFKSKIHTIRKDKRKFFPEGGISKRFKLRMKNMPLESSYSGNYEFNEINDYAPPIIPFKKNEQNELNYPSTDDLSTSDDEIRTIFNKRKKVINKLHFPVINSSDSSSDEIFTVMEKSHRKISIEKESNISKPVIRSIEILTPSRYFRLINKI